MRSDAYSRLKRQLHNFDPAIIQPYEDKIIDFITDKDFVISDEISIERDDGWTLVESIPDGLAFAISNPFERMVIHNMCRYYGLESRTELVGEEKLMMVKHQPQTKLPRVKFIDLVFGNKES